MRTDPLRCSPLLIGLSLAACARDKAGTLDTSTPDASLGDGGGRLQGVLRDLSGQALAGATVSAAGLETTTDLGGFFYLDGLPVGEVVVVSATLQGYSSGSARRTILAEGWTTLELRLMATDSVQWSPSTDGATLVLDQVWVDFSGGLSTEDGAEITEPITASYSFIDTPEEIRAAPGGMVATTDAGEVPLESFGMVELRLSDAQGRAVQPTTAATLSFPLAATADAAEGASASLYGFDEERGTWSLEGEGRVEGGRFVASVSHFSWWNCDEVVAVESCVTGRLVQDGAPVAHAVVALIDAVHLWYAETTTDDDGAFTMPIGQGEPVSLTLTYGLSTWSSGELVVNFPSTVGCEDLGDLEVTPGDLDGDGFLSEALGGPDCDDGLGAINPMAEEVWYSGVDEDCDGDDADQDRDGYAWEGYAFDVPEDLEPGDCDDTHRAVRPDRSEVCDGVDNDCDGLLDALDTNLANGSTTWPDEDGDGFGDADAEPFTTCEEAPDGSSEVNTDCDDGDASVYPGASEACGDSRDRNCDGVIIRDTESECVDLDGDGVNAASDCDDGDASVYPGAPEVCDGVDQDCDGGVDDDAIDAADWHLDADADGYGASASERACEAPVGTVADGSDCNDGDDDVHPGARDGQCDSVDDDCDGDSDEDAWWVGPEGSSGGYDYDNLHDAIDGASAGDGVCVVAGSYTGPVTWEDKDLLLVGMDGAELTTLDAMGGGTALTVANLSDAARLSGFTLTGGVGTNGGGLSVVGADLTVSDLIVEGNRASGSGGGLYVYDSASALSDLIIRDNSAGTQGGGALLAVGTGSVTGLLIEGNTAGGKGGGLAFGVTSCSGASWVLSDAEISGNTAVSDAGGAYVCPGGAPALYEVVIADNASGGEGGGIYADTASGAYVLDGVTLTGNTAAKSGGGAHLYGDSHATVIRLSASGNTAGNRGGGLLISNWDMSMSEIALYGNTAAYGGGLAVSSCDLILSDATISGNTATGTAGGVDLRGTLTATNLLVSHNSAAAGGGVDDHYPGATYSTLTATYSDIWGNSPDDVPELTFEAGSDGNLSVDPELVLLDLGVDASTWDLRLSSGSPLIDAGDPSLLDDDGSVSDIGSLGAASP